MRLIPGYGPVAGWWELMARRVAPSVLLAGEMAMALEPMGKLFVGDAIGGADGLSALTAHNFF